MQGRIQVQIAKRQVRTLELGDRILQLGIERRQLVRVEGGAADALPAGFGQYFLERTLRLAGRLLKRGVAALLPLQKRREVRRHHSIRGELRADRRNFLEEIEAQIAVEIALAELEGERCRIGLGAVLELGKRRTGDLEIERLSLHLSMRVQLQVGVGAARDARELGGDVPSAAEIVVANRGIADLQPTDPRQGRRPWRSFLSLTELPIGRPVGARLEQEIGLRDPEFRQHDLALDQLEQIDRDLDAIDLRHGRIAAPGRVAELGALDR